MKAIETDIIVSRDGRARIDLNLSADVPPGRHRAVVVLDERPVLAEPRREDSSLADFPVHDLGPWPEKLSLRRADLYGDDER
jgi:hypothetical protein